MEHARLVGRHHRGFWGIAQVRGEISIVLAISTLAFLSYLFYDTGRWAVAAGDSGLLIRAVPKSMVIGPKEAFPTILSISYEELQSFTCIRSTIILPEGGSAKRESLRFRATPLVEWEIISALSDSRSQPCGAFIPYLISPGPDGYRIWYTDGWSPRMQRLLEELRKHKVPVLPVVEEIINLQDMRDKPEDELRRDMKRLVGLNMQLAALLALQRVRGVSWIDASWYLREMWTPVPQVQSPEQSPE